MDIAQRHNEGDPSDLVARQAKARAAAKAKREDVVREDSEWSGEKFVEQSDKLVSE